MSDGCQNYDKGQRTPAGAASTLTQAEIYFEEMERATKALHAAARHFCKEWSKTAPETSFRAWCDASDKLESAAVDYTRAKNRWEGR